MFEGILHNYNLPLRLFFPVLCKYDTLRLLKTINAQSFFIFFVADTFVTHGFRPILLHILHDMFHNNN